MATLNGVPPRNGEDAVAASVRKMSSQEADECSALIVEIYGLTSRALQRSGNRVTAERTADR